MLRSMWDLSSPTRDFTRAPYSRGKEKLQSFINESEYPVVEKQTQNCFYTTRFFFPFYATF